MWISEHSYETRVNACGEYLAGRSTIQIAAKYGIKTPSLITYWIKQRGCFKIRRPQRGKESQEAQTDSPPIAGVRAPVEKRTYHKSKAPQYLIDMFKDGIGPQVKKTPVPALEQK